MSSQKTLKNAETISDKKSICISRSAWQALQEFKLVILGNRSYSDSIINVKHQLSLLNLDYQEILQTAAPLPSHLLEKASLSRNSRKNGRSKTVVLSNEAWKILNSIKQNHNCKSYSEAILYLYHVYSSVILAECSDNTLTNSILNENYHPIAGHK